MSSEFLPAVSGLPLLEIPTHRALEAMPEDELLGRALAVHATAQQAAAERGAVAGLFLCEIKARCEADGRSFKAWVEEHWPHARSTAYAWIALASQVQQNSVRLSDTSPGLARLAITVERERKAPKSPQVQQDSVRPSDTAPPSGPAPSPQDVPVGPDLGAGAAPPRGEPEALAAVKATIQARSPGARIQARRAELDAEEARASPAHVPTREPEPAADPAHVEPLLTALWPSGSPVVPTLPADVKRLGLHPDQVVLAYVVGFAKKLREWEEREGLVSDYARQPLADLRLAVEAGAQDLRLAVRVTCKGGAKCQ